MISSAARVSGWTAAREGDVDPLGLEQGRVPGRLQLDPAPFEGGLQLGAGLVDAAAELAAGLGAERAEASLDLAERRAPRQVGLLGAAQLVEVACAGKGGPAGLDQDVEVGFGGGGHAGAPGGSGTPMGGRLLPRVSSAGRSPRRAGGSRSVDPGQLQAPAGQTKSDLGAAAHLGAGPDAPAVGLDQAPGDEQAEAGARGRAGAGAPVELGEDEGELVRG